MAWDIKPAGEKMPPLTITSVEAPFIALDAKQRVVLEKRLKEDQSNKGAANATPASPGNSKTIG